MLLDSLSLSKSASEISALGDPVFNGETSLFIEDIINNKSDYKVFAAFREEKVAGFLILSAVLDEAEILEVAVDVNLRRKGIASELMSGIFDWCEKNGITQIFLEVRESNLPAKKYYCKFGFSESGLRKNYYKNPSENAVLMSRKLSGAS